MRLPDRFATSYVPRGEWLPWLERNFAMTPRHAQNFMRLARNREQIRNAFPIRDALKMLGSGERADRAVENSSHPERKPIRSAHP